MCPHPIHVCAYDTTTCVIILYVSSDYMCPHTMCPHTMCPHTILSVTSQGLVVKRLPSTSMTDIDCGISGERKHVVLLTKPTVLVPQPKPTLLALN